MNYRHIYHAGNFADIFKHIVLTLVISYMQRKPAAFRLIDTHAGAGFYRLDSAEAVKTAEWQSGLARFLQLFARGSSKIVSKQSEVYNYPQIFADAAIAEPLLAPYMQVLAAACRLNGDTPNELRCYPGSPWLARYLLRKQDRLTVTELHQEDYHLLRRLFAGDYQTKALHLNGWLTLKAQLPPKEKRGLILIDPPFEQTNEFDTIAEGMRQALRRFPQGVYMLWYPVKNYHAIDKFTKTLTQYAAENSAGAVLQAELRIRRPSPVPRLDGSGLILINPPYFLAEQLKQLRSLFLRAFAENNQAMLQLRQLRHS